MYASTPGWPSSSRRLVAGQGSRNMCCWCKDWPRSMIPILSPAGNGILPAGRDGSLPPANRSREWSKSCQGTRNERSFVSEDRKSTRLNSSHPSISYAVFCLKKKTELAIIGHLGQLTRSHIRFLHCLRHG